MGFQEDSNQDIRAAIGGIKMIITASMRTDIPAFYGTWFYNRIKAGYVDVLNPYDKEKKSYYRYSLNPDIVDAISFCSKNPYPFLTDMRFHELKEMYPMLWGVTITGYSEVIEPNVPTVQYAISDFKKLSNIMGPEKVSWRYDPICFMTDKNNGENMDMHFRCFTYIASNLESYTDKVVISFMDHYNKVSMRTNKIIRPNESCMLQLVDDLADIAYRYGMKLYLCHDKIEGLNHHNLIQNNCFTIEEVNQRLGLNLKRPKQANARSGCDCVLNADIGQYNTCFHDCIYCYAQGSRSDLEKVQYMHFDDSSCLIGRISEDSIIKQAKQVSWKVSE